MARKPTAKKAGADASIKATVTVKNTGKRRGEEVVQLYLAPLEARRPRALKELRGIERVTLEPGASRQVAFTVKPDRDRVIYDDVKKDYTVDPGQFEVLVGASSADIRARATLVVQ